MHSSGPIVYFIFSCGPPVSPIRTSVNGNRCLSVTNPWSLRHTSSFASQLHIVLLVLHVFVIPQLHPKMFDDNESSKRGFANQLIGKEAVVHCLSS